MIAPATGSLPAKNLLIIGLGDTQTFTPQRMELVGSIAYREFSLLGIVHPYFAPTVFGASRGKLVQDSAYLAGQADATDSKQGIQRAIAHSGKEPATEFPNNLLYHRRQNYWIRVTS